MDWKTFRALETFAIRYDIRIDEEQDAVGPCLVKVDDSLQTPWKECSKYAGRFSTLWPWEGRTFRLFPATDGIFPKTDLTLSIPAEADGDVLWPGSQPSKFLMTLSTGSPDGPPDIEGYWARLLLAKYVRGRLMAALDTAADDAFQALGDLVSDTCPAIPEHMVVNPTEGPSPTDEDWQRFLLALMYMNEAGACYRGYQSIAIADKCLDVLRDAVGAWRLRSNGVTAGGSSTDDEVEGLTPHELVALYNKAQGYLHARQHKDALRSFHEVSTEWWKAYRKNRLPKDLWWREDEQQLWRAYVFVPSVFQAADTVTNLQRSRDSLDELKKLDEPSLSLTPYQILRRNLLELRAQADMDQFNKDDERKVARDKLSSLLKTSEDNNWQRLRLQVLSVLTQLDTATAREKDGRFFGWVDERVRAAHSHRSEFDQAVLAWAKALLEAAKAADSSKKPDALAHLISHKLPDSAKKWPAESDSYLDAALDLAMDERYREHKVELRTTLVAALDKLLPSPPLPREGMNTDLRRRLSGAADQLWNWAQQRPSSRAPVLPEIAKHELKLLSELWANAADVTPRSDDEARVVRRFLAKTLIQCKSMGGEQGEAACPKSYQCVNGVTGVPDDDCLAIFSGSREWRQIAGQTPAGQTGDGWRHFWDIVVGRNRRILDSRLRRSGIDKVHTPSGVGFLVLQRWNSFTPALQASPGGGYFAFCQNKGGERSGCDRTGCGLAIDPGYSFLRNFFAEGFAISDLDAVVVTHDHPDHHADFEAIKNLLAEYDKQRHGSQAAAKKRVAVLLSEGAFKHLSPSIESGRDLFSDARVIRSGTRNAVSAVDDCTCVQVLPVTALHRDLSQTPGSDGSDSLGLRIELKSGDKKCSVGVTCDTRYHEAGAKAYSDCRVLVLHLGGLVADHHSLVDYFLGAELDELVYRKDHLYLPGVIWLLAGCHNPTQADRPRLVILSEFGEEMRGGLREDLARRLQEYVDSHLDRAFVIVPGDVGLLVDPLDESIRCSCCGEFFPWYATTPAFKFEVFGHEEHIFYVCPACQHCTSSHQRQVMYSRKQRAVEAFLGNA